MIWKIKITALTLYEFAVHYFFCTRVSDAPVIIVNRSFGERVQIIMILICIVQYIFYHVSHIIQFSWFAVHEPRKELNPSDLVWSSQDTIISPAHPRHCNSQEQSPSLCVVYTSYRTYMWSSEAGCQEGEMI